MVRVEWELNLGCKVTFDSLVNSEFSFARLNRASTRTLYRVNFKTFVYQRPKSSNEVTFGLSVCCALNLRVTFLASL